MRIITALSLALFAASATPASADNADLMALVRGDHWHEAQAAAAGYLDPVVPKLVTYFRLMAPGAASFDEIMAFQHDSPDWPMPASLARRRDEALAMMIDDVQAAQACDRAPPALPGAKLRCADAYAKAGRTAEANAAANAGWILTDPSMEPIVLARWAPVLTAEAQLRRFDALLSSDVTAASRQLSRLAGADYPLAEARLALHRDAPNAEALAKALPASQFNSPPLFLEMAKFLRRANRDEEAVAFWRQAGTQAESAIDPARRAAFWDERNLLARRRLRQGDNLGAYAIAAGHAQTSGEGQLDAEFLAGFIALRKLGDPALATRHFQLLAATSKAVITQARAHYWLGRAGGGVGEYAEAAKYPNTYYGQLALIALGQDPAQVIQAAREPAVDTGRALELAGREVARAAAYLVAWGERSRAQSFLFRLDDIAPDPADRALVARLALGFGAPETAVALARRAGRDGLVQLDTGWPVAVRIPDGTGLDPSLGLGIIRQESSFDGTTTSPVGARGLMQLMPATAATVAKQLGTKATLIALTTDPALNMRLGSTYLKGLLDQFGGVVPFAVAGYNAGPGRVGQWTNENGDPRGANTGIDMIDWIELIPFGETRNYVQRVIENQVVYAAKTQAHTPHPLAVFLRSSS